MKDVPVVKKGKMNWIARQSSGRFRDVLDEAEKLTLFSAVSSSS